MKRSILMCIGGACAGAPMGLVVRARAGYLSRRYDAVGARQGETSALPRFRSGNARSCGRRHKQSRLHARQSGQCGPACIDLGGIGPLLFRSRQASCECDRGDAAQRRRCEHDASCLGAIAAIRNFVALQFERTRHDRARLAAARCGTGQALALPQLRNRQYRRARLREHGAIGRRGQRSLARRFQVLRGG